MAALPRFLGALYQGMAEGLQRLPETVVEESVRMSDFARWVHAALPTLGKACAITLPGGDEKQVTYNEAFMFKLRQSVNEGRAIALDAWLLLPHLIEFIATYTNLLKKKEWQGTASELLEGLKRDYMAECKTHDIQPTFKDWPHIHSQLSNQLKRNMTSLRDNQILDVTPATKHYPRIITIKPLANCKTRF